MTNKEIIKDTLILVLNVLKDENKISSFNNRGICAVLQYLDNNKTISRKTFKITNNFIRANKPNNVQHQEFTKNIYWIGGMFWWYPIRSKNETRQIRIEFITKLINSL